MRYSGLTGASINCATSNNLVGQVVLGVPFQDPIQCYSFESVTVSCSKIIVWPLILTVWLPFSFTMHGVTILLKPKLSLLSRPTFDEMSTVVFARQLLQGFIPDTFHENSYLQ
jgi:hypothetical protein